MPVLSSTLLLTLLLAVGLAFFIRAATKDRTQTVEFTARQSSEALDEQLLNYFQQRAYELDAADSEAADTEAAHDWIRMKGQVRPSVFLALFLGALAAIGLLCLALVLAILFPGQKLVWGVVAIAPLAVIFYWQRAAREETIAYRVEEQPNKTAALTFRGHRDEIIQMAANLPITKREA